MISREEEEEGHAQRPRSYLAYEHCAAPRESRYLPLIR